MTVAHYTKKEISKKLFFDKITDEKTNIEKSVNFRLSTITTSNDTQEGKTLFSYLFDNQKIRPQSEQYVAFVGCFTFNHDNLNQFRLYGKNNAKEEGTGISIVMKPDFFSQEDKSPLMQAGIGASQDNNKAPLFRCIYIDPETNQIVSIGHRDYHTFYNESANIFTSHEQSIDFIEGNIIEYQKEIDDKLEEVKRYLTELKEIIAKVPLLNYGVVCNILLNLRYLVKHVAFKEEQECRIVELKRYFESDKNKPIDEDDKHERFYLDYLPLAGYVNKIYFGPKATGMELFQSLLTFQKGFEKVICYRSTSPLA
jgi:hypothetical protein